MLQSKAKFPGFPAFLKQEYLISSQILVPYALFKLKLIYFN